MPLFRWRRLAAERHVEQFGGQFLRRRRLDIGVIDNPIELDILWRCIERFGCIQQQLAQCGNPLMSLNDVNNSTNPHAIMGLW